MTDIYDKFRETVESRKLISPGDRILLSLSAGKDSMTMLDMMMRYRETVDFKLGIFHLNHLTRGTESDKDEALVREKAEKSGIPLNIKQFDFKSGKIAGISFEEQARNIRYSLIDEIMSSENFNKAATAHNSMDNAETILMRIFSGTGIYGLRGISYINNNVIRPILDISPDDIYSYLRERDIEWREDLSNLENVYQRNYIRNIVFPAIKSKFPDAENNINRLSAHAEENEELLSFLLESVNPEWLLETATGHFISIEHFSGNIPFVKHMLSRTLYNYYGIRLNSVIFSEIIRRYESKKSNLTIYEKDDILIRKKNHNNNAGIEITDLKKQKKIPDKWEYELELNNQFGLFIIELNRYINCKKSSHEEFSNLKGDSRYIFIKIPSSTKKILLRNRREGDRIVLETGVKKIKELMIEKKLDIYTKKRVPLIIVDNEIAAYLPGAVESCPHRVSCNFWIDDCTENMFVFYFTDSPDLNIIK